MPRLQAENERDVVQPIPCAYVRSREGDILLLHRTDAARKDLRSRLSLVVGGHVDYSPEVDDLNNIDLESLFLHTLEREVWEELHVPKFVTANFAALIIDHSTTAASRHIAFVYEVQADSAVRVAATEEFTASSVLSGRFIPWTKIPVFRNQLDPWSDLLVRHHLTA